MKRNLTTEEARYNRDSLLCDSFVSFHPEAFDVLSSEERRDLFEFYPQDLDEIPDAFEYRRAILRRHPGIEERARTLLAKVLNPLGIEIED